MARRREEKAAAEAIETCARGWLARRRVRRLRVVVGRWCTLTSRGIKGGLVRALKKAAAEHLAAVLAWHERHALVIQRVARGWHGRCRATLCRKEEERVWVAACHPPPMLSPVQALAAHHVETLSLIDAVIAAVAASERVLHAVEADAEANAGLATGGEGGASHAGTASLDTADATAGGAGKDGPSRTGSLRSLGDPKDPKGSVGDTRRPGAGRRVPIMGLCAMRAASDSYMSILEETVAATFC